MEYVAPYLPVVVLSGYVEAGKDTVAAMIQRLDTFATYAFADKLRETLERLNPWVFVRDLDPEVCSEIVQHRHMRLLEALDFYGNWENLKRANPVEIRELMQNQGHLCRDIFGRECWAHALGAQIVLDLHAQAANCWEPFQDKVLNGILIKDRRQTYEDYSCCEVMVKALSRCFNHDTDEWEHKGPCRNILGPIRVWVQRDSRGPINNADSERSYGLLKKEAHYTINNPEWGLDGDEALKAEVGKFMHWLYTTIIHAPLQVQLDKWAYNV